MRDEDKPRRSRSEELAEIAAGEAHKHAGADAQLAYSPPNPPLSMIVAQMQADDETADCARERAETPEEAAQSARILAAEAVIAAEIPVLRDRELRRTFSKPQPAQAAMASN